MEFSTKGMKLSTISIISSSSIAYEACKTDEIYLYTFKGHFELKCQFVVHLQKTKAWSNAIILCLLNLIAKRL
jgi:hypothetical protein